MEHLDTALPEATIDRLTRPLARFVHVQAASGVVLFIASVVAIVLANTAWGEAVYHFWETPFEVVLGSFVFHSTVLHLINDGLMAIFFFVIGLEVKREIVSGELRDIRKAVLPIFAAVGGMIVPAGIYLAVVGTGEAHRGWGIPMATDIAFVVGCLAILGNRVPNSLRVMLLSLAIADDIGAILVIAIGYTESISWSWLVVGLLGIGLTSRLAVWGVRSFGVYTMIGAVIWFAFHESGIHATIAGVILGLMTPAQPLVDRGLAGRILDKAKSVLAGDDWDQLKYRAERVRTLERVARESISPLEYLESVLHPWVSFLIMPLFALANAGVALSGDSIGSQVSLAVFLGLVIGKPAGIVIFSLIAVALGFARLPERTTMRMFVGGGFLAGIGFTMALFIADLALSGDALNSAKAGILLGSVAAAVIGSLLLALGKNSLADNEEPSSS
jgi:NhaA family Na+:H+ antiporter